MSSKTKRDVVLPFAVGRKAKPPLIQGVVHMIARIRTDNVTLQVGQRVAYKLDPAWVGVVKKVGPQYSVVKFDDTGRETTMGNDTLVPEPRAQNTGRQIPLGQR